MTSSNLWESFIISKDQLQKYWLLSLVAHWFELVEFRIFVVVFFRQAKHEKIKTNIQYSEFETSKSMSHHGHLEMTYGVPVSHGLAEGYNVRNNIFTLEFKGPPFGSYTSKPNLYLVSYAYSSSGPYMFVDFSYNEFITCLHKFCITNLRFFFMNFLLLSSYLSYQSYHKQFDLYQKHSIKVKFLKISWKKFVVKEFVKTCDELVLR